MITRDTPLQARIRKHWTRGIEYHALMNLVFPYDEYPSGWRYSSNGGPPAVAMPFGKALRLMGGYYDSESKRVYLP